MIYTEQMDKEITNVTETIRGSFENLESEIENILSEWWQWKKEMPFTQKSQQKNVGDLQLSNYIRNV